MNKYLTFLFLIIAFSCKKEDDAPPAPPIPVDTTVKIVQDVVGDAPVVVAGGVGLNIIVSFERTLPDGTVLDFSTPVQGLPNIMQDSEGTVWDIFGKAVSGPREGEQLTPLNSYMGFWFAWATMHPGIEIYGNTAPADNYAPPTIDSNWTIPTTNVYVGAGLDAIPALESPEFLQYRGKDYLDEEFYVEDQDLVVGIRVGEEYRLYPIPILNWHEIVNDEMGGLPLAITYCPLTGTSVAWDRTIGGEVTTFGVSGFLYNNNLLPYDRNSESVWSQMRTECINGDLLATQLETYPLVETTWANWKNIIDEPTILSDNTGYGRDYTSYPYGDYDTDHNYLTFPIDFDDNRLPRKERVHGVVVGDKAKVYRFENF